MSQTNLIKNGSFESYAPPIDCNNSSFEVSGSPSNHHIVDFWYTFSSPDYYNAICNFTSNFSNVPKARFGDSYAKHGSAYAGIISFSKTTETKEYIYQLLSQPLIADTVYCLSFFVTRGDRVTHAIKNLGAYFSQNLPSSVYYINALPQVVNNSGFISDTINWTEINGCFTAIGGEQYLTIGNFNGNVNTDTLFVGTTNQLFGTNGYGYYYIDSVSLWQNSFPVGIKEQAKNELVSVYPNPAKDVITFKFADATEKRRIEIYDAIGGLVISEETNSNNLTLTTNNLTNGVYFYTIKQNNFILKQAKFVIIK